MRKYQNEITEALSMLKNSRLSLNQAILIKGFARHYKRNHILTERQTKILFELKRLHFPENCKDVEEMASKTKVKVVNDSTIIN